MTTLWSGVRGFGLFWWDFLVGDDWTVAVGVLVALGATYGLVQADLAGWWLLPPAVVAILALSIRRADRCERPSVRLASPGHEKSQTEVTPRA